MIKKIINYFNGFKLRNKLLISYLFVILLPVASIGYFLINRTIANVMEHEEYTSRINGRQIAANISDKLDDLLALTSNIYYEDQLMDFLQTINPHSDTLQRYNEYKTQFDRYSKRFPINFGSLMKLSIYTTNTTILPDGYFIIHITDELASQDWFREACEAKGQSIFLEPFTKDDAARNIGGNRFLAIVRLLDPFSSSGVVNVLKLDVPEMDIYRLIETEGINKEIYVLNQNNTIMSSSIRESFGKDANTFPHLRNILSTQKVSGEIYYDDEQNTIYYHEIKSNSAVYGWKIITIVSAQNLIGKIRNTVAYSVFICLMSVIITVIIVYLFSNTLTRRLKLLVKNMSMVSEGNFKVFVDCSGTDEISELARDFKIMVEKVNALINEVYILDIKKKEAEFNALQSQINPHFLFNTMESIRMNLWNRQDYATSEIIQQFALLLRKSIERTDDIIPIYQESELVETYLKIQKYRYGEKLEYEINIPETFYYNIIPKFTLQPIVENAVYHGICQKKGKGKLSIIADKLGDFLCITVEDNGAGMVESKLKEINEQLSENQADKGSGRIGIRNVHQRLRLYFGSPYGMTITSRKNVGTRVEILLPIMTKQEMKKCITC